VEDDLKNIGVKGWRIKHWIGQNGIHKVHDEGDDRVAPGEDQFKWRPKL
jgi:hypothetical protein